MALLRAQQHGAASDVSDALWGRYSWQNQIHTEGTLPAFNPSLVSGFAPIVQGFGTGYQQHRCSDLCQQFPWM